MFVGASSPQTGGRSSEPSLSIAELIDNVKAQGELHSFRAHTADVFGFAKESLPVLTVIAGRAQLSVTSLDNQTSVMLADEVEPSSGRRDYRMLRISTSGKILVARHALNGHEVSLSDNERDDQIYREKAFWSKRLAKGDSGKAETPPK